MATKIVPAARAVGESLRGYLVTESNVARRLTSESPTHLAIVLERFQGLEHFVDESLNFGDPAVVKEMFAHVPSFYDFETAITGGMSEYRFS